MNEVPFELITSRDGGREAVLVLPPVASDKHGVSYVADEAGNLDIGFGCGTHLCLTGLSEASLSKIQGLDQLHIAEVDEGGILSEYVAQRVNENNRHNQTEGAHA